MGVLYMLPSNEFSNGFICPLVPFVPCTGMAANIYLIAHLPTEALWRLIIWTALGFIVYFSYGTY